MNQKNWLVLSVGIIIGVSAASAYWHSTLQRSKFLFDQNVICQGRAKQYQADNNTPGHLVMVLGAAYSSKLNSCVAEVRKVEKGGIDYTVEDLFSGDLLFYGHHNAGEYDIDPKKMIADQDAKFARFAH